MLTDGSHVDADIIYIRYRHVSTEPYTSFCVKVHKYMERNSDS